jgi:DNA-binding CsgD family transcriptional regulator
MNSARIVEDRPAETEIGSLCGRPLLVVSVLDGTMSDASVRRRLRIALSALDHMQDEGILRLDAAGRIVCASGSAKRILRDFVETPAVRLPQQIADWHENACGTLVIAADGSTLVVEATEGGSALLLTEQPSGVRTLTPRENDVMRCVEDGLSNNEIARRLRIQPPTVRKHLEHVFDKLGVQSRTAALSKLHAFSKSLSMLLPLSVAVASALAGQGWGA